MPVRVFVSHSHEDRVLSRAVRRLLFDSLGLKDDEVLVTSDASTGLDQGSKIHEELLKAARSAEVFIMLITPASGDRPWLNFEGGAADSLDKRVYVLKHPAAAMPATMAHRKATSIDNDGELAALIEAIRSDLGIETPPGIAKTIEAVSDFVAEAKAYNPELTMLRLGKRLELQIGFGDVIEWQGSIALPCDDRFDITKAGEGSQLYERTLIGQFRNRFLPSLDLDAFRAHMVKRLGGAPASGRFEIGHTSATPLVERAAASDRRMLFLVVLFSVTERGGVTEGGSTALDVWSAYESLWQAVCRVRPEAVAVPLLGAGQSGTGLTSQQSCLLAVASAACVALTKPIFTRLHLLARTRPAYRALNVPAIADAMGLQIGSN